MGTLVQDIRYSLRILGKTPVVSLIAVLSLALGIGGNSAMFSVTQAVLLRPPALKDLDRLVMLWGTSRGEGRSLIAGADLVDWRKQSRLFDALELSDAGAGPSTVTAGGIPERIRREYVSANLFQTLRVQPQLGRSFSEEEVRRGTKTVILGYEFWVRRFGANQNVLGNSLILNGNPVTIIGVMPRQFGILSDDTDIWEPLDAPGTDDMSRKIPWLVGIGRLKPGVTLAAAQVELSGIARQLAQEYPETNKDRGVLLDPLANALTQGLQEFLMPLFGAVGFVLVIGCANVANLLLARVTARRREMVIRAALGASRRRIVSQLLTESVILASFGGLLGLVVAFWGIKLFQVLAPVWFPKMAGIALNWSVTGFTLALSIATGMLAGIAPAIQASRPDLNECLKQASRGSTGVRARTRGVLVVSEIALAFVLLIGAGLMVNSLVRLLHVNPGFDPQKLLTMQIDLSGPRYIQPVELRNDIQIFLMTPRVESFYKTVLERAHILPGIDSAALVSWLPQGKGAVGPYERNFTITGRPVPPSSEQPHARYNMVSPEYFRTMGIQLIRGRFLTEQDANGMPWVTVVSEGMARRFWPNQDPIGQLLTLTMIKEERPRQVVGVVSNVRQWLADEARPEFYAPFEQQPPVYGDGWQNRMHRYLVLRTVLQPESVMSAIRAEVRLLDRDQPVYDLRTMDELVTASTAPWRFYSILLGIFSGMALFLAAIGIYGVISYAVGERTHEIGIRMAIGAARRDVLGLILRQGLKLTMTGLAIGLAASFAMTRVIAGFLYNVQPTDPFTLAAASVLLAAIAGGAIMQPARRASRVHPMEALRHE